MKVGSFSAASNVTGLLTDVPAVTAMLHANAALACWDYAGRPRRHSRHRRKPARTRCSYRRTNSPAARVLPESWPFAGGLIHNPVPTVPGGGTISYVHRTGQFYLDDPAVREEGGTPAIVESIRAGLVFALKDSVDPHALAQREAELARRVIDEWRTHPGIEVLGNPDRVRLPIVSFTVRPPGRRALHHGFVVAVLSDLFGVQCRGGCSCAGPYGHRLLGIDDPTADGFAALAVTAGWV